MEAVAPVGGGRRRADGATAAAVAVALGTVGVLAAAYADRAPVVCLGALTLAIWAALTHHFFLQFRVLLAALVLVVMFIPIGRYSLPAQLPFQLEPYRLLVAAVTVIVLISLLAQPQTRYKQLHLGGAFGAIAVAMLVSVGVNSGYVHDLGVEAEVIKSLTFFASFFVVAILFNTMITTRTDLETVLKVLAGSGAVLGVLTIIESRTGLTPFDSLGTVIPVLKFEGAIDTLEQRGGDVRALGSSQHPIALGAVLALLFPLAIHVAREHRKRIWWVCAGAIAIGVLTTVARTATLMLLVEVVVLLILKPKVMLRLWPWALPFLIVVHFAVPGTLGSLKESFFPRGGLVAEQQTGAGTYGSNRLADLGPSLEEWRKSPFAGQGWGTRITDRKNPKHNAPILDNQWLGTLLELGLLGVVAFGWLFVRSVRRLGRAARRDPGDDGWLLASLAAAIAAFGVGMFTYDAFAFTQAIIVLFMLVGIGGAALRLRTVV
jgi:hypothetical protein